MQRSEARVDMICRIHLARILIAAWLLAVPGRPFDADRVRACTPVLVYAAGGISTKCYSPSDIMLAERQAPIHLLPPQAIVTSLTGLSLTQADLITQAYSGTQALTGRITIRPGVHLTWRPTGLVYVFSPVRSLPLSGKRCVALPRYVFVSEIINHSTQTGTTIRKDFPDNATCPWIFSANVPSRSLSLEITSNTGYGVVSKLGALLLQEANRP